MKRLPYVAASVVAGSLIAAVAFAQGKPQIGNQPIGKIPVDEVTKPSAPKPMIGGPATGTRTPNLVFDKSKIVGTGVFLQTNVGSFKIKRGSEDPDMGILDLTFKGTVLVSGLKGTVVPSAGARLDYDRKDRNKTVYFSPGGGKLHVEGLFEGIQFFGQNMNASYRGTGVLQLFGEFDKNLNTGFYWYGDAPNDKKYWGTGGTTITPSHVKSMGQSPSGIRIKDVTGKG